MNKFKFILVSALLVNGSVNGQTAEPLTESYENISVNDKTFKLSPMWQCTNLFNTQQSGAISRTSAIVSGNLYLSQYSSADKVMTVKVYDAETGEFKGVMEDPAQCLIAKSYSHNVICADDAGNLLIANMANTASRFYWASVSTAHPLAPIGVGNEYLEIKGRFKAVAVKGDAVNGQATMVVVENGNSETGIRDLEILWVYDIDHGTYSEPRKYTVSEDCKSDNFDCQLLQDNLIALHSDFGTLRIFSLTEDGIEEVGLNVPVALSFESTSDHLCTWITTFTTEGEDFLIYGNKYQSSGYYCTWTICPVADLYKSTVSGVADKAREASRSWTVPQDYIDRPHPTVHDVAVGRNATRDKVLMVMQGDDSTPGKSWAYCMETSNAQSLISELTVDNEMVTVRYSDGMLQVVSPRATEIRLVSAAGSVVGEYKITKGVNYLSTETLPRGIYLLHIPGQKATKVAL